MRGAVCGVLRPLFSARLCAVCLVFQRELFSASISKANASTLHHWETTSAHASDRHAMRRHRTLIAHHTIYYPSYLPISVGSVVSCRRTFVAATSFTASSFPPGPTNKTQGRSDGATRSTPLTQASSRAEKRIEPAAPSKRMRTRVSDRECDAPPGALGRG